MNVSELMTTVETLRGELVVAGANDPIISLDLQGNKYATNWSIHVMEKTGKEYRSLHYDGTLSRDLSEKMDALAAFVADYKSATDRLADILGIAS